MTAPRSWPVDGSDQRRWQRRRRPTREPGPLHSGGPTRKAPPVDGPPPHPTQDPDQKPWGTCLIAAAAVTAGAIVLAVTGWGAPTQERVDTPTTAWSTVDASGGGAAATTTTRLVVTAADAPTAPTATAAREDHGR